MFPSFRFFDVLVTLFNPFLIKSMSITITALPSLAVLFFNCIRVAPFSSFADIYVLFVEFFSNNDLPREPLPPSRL